MPDEKHSLKAFLCHAHGDKYVVKALYVRLIKDGVDAWLDKEKLLPGQDWKLEIRKAVSESDVVIVCLSNQFKYKGYRQVEVSIALEEAALQPEGEIFIIPARLEECETLESLKKYHWVDLFNKGGYEKLMQSLKLRAKHVGMKAPQLTQPKLPFKVDNDQTEISVGNEDLETIKGGITIKGLYDTRNF